jgi:hypothetical protein
MRRGAIGGGISTVAAGVAILAMAAPAAAINTYNSEPAPERTEVGAFVALWDTDDDGVVDRLDWVCSGAMVDDDTFLTAAHCTDDWPTGTRFFVSLEQDFQTPLDDALAAEPTASLAAEALLADGVIVEGDAHQDAAFPGPASDSHDIAVLDFASREVTPADVWSFTPATLPTAGLLDTIGRDALSASSWLAVGYGTEEALRGPGGQSHPGGGTRRKAAEGFTALNKAWVRLDMHESHDFGGACYGDSGGPNYVTIGGQLVLAATTITGDTPCYATNVAYRTDTAGARAFLAAFVELPEL